ncbi:MAG: ACP S-malonyltransferase [Anaerovoracaceae bacterium]|jgi:[acyl-carrier-protein] S-malonyltransferase
MKIGLVFSGQGAQYPGMGRDLCENSPEAAAVFDAAGDEIRKLCFDGTKEQLAQTRVTQPTIYTVTMAAYEAFMASMRKAGLSEITEVTGRAGFSLGEYASLTSAGVIDDIRKGLEIVEKRGVFMQEAGQDENGENISGMTAALGRRAAVLDAVEKAALETGMVIEAVNFNTASQTVVAGEKPALEAFARIAKENRIKAIPLSVSTAFHCALMKPAAERLLPVLQAAELKYPDAQGILYSDSTARDIMDGYEGDPDDAEAAGGYLAEMMAAQAMSPVHWQEITEDMAARGAKAIIEFGPGKTLTGFTKKNARGVLALHVEDTESLDETIRALSENAG